MEVVICVNSLLYVINIQKDSFPSYNILFESKMIMVKDITFKRVKLQQYYQERAIIFMTDSHLQHN
jgi:hypothetical protein